MNISIKLRTDRHNLPTRNSGQCNCHILAPVAIDKQQNLDYAAATADHRRRKSTTQTGSLLKTSRGFEAVFKRAFRYAFTAAVLLSVPMNTNLAWSADGKDATVAPIKLTPEETAERESRKACKVEICRAFRKRTPGDNIACNVVKTWRKEQLNRMVKKARVSWPWGRVTCKTDIKLKRAELIKSMTEPKYELALDKHTVSCQVQREKEPADIKFSFAPKVKFEKGSAKKASLNWGKIEAPTLIKGAMWTATATDNTFNVLENTLVEDINNFISTKCDEVKADWQN